MTIDTNQVLSITETNQNFSKAARIADRQGSVVVFKNNKPKYMLINLENNPLIDLTDEEKPLRNWQNDKVQPGQSVTVAPITHRTDRWRRRGSGLWLIRFCAGSLLCYV